LRFVATSTLQLLAPGTPCELARPGQKYTGAAIKTGRILDKVRKALRDVDSDNLGFGELVVSNEAQAKTAVDEAVLSFGAAF
jgi:hypothetical protein